MYDASFDVHEEEVDSVTLPKTVVPVDTCQTYCGVRTYC